MGASWICEWYIHLQHRRSVSHKNKIYAQGPQTCAEYDAGLVFAVDWMVTDINVWLTIGCVHVGDDFGGDVLGTAAAGRAGWAS